MSINDHAAIAARRARHQRSGIDRSQCAWCRDNPEMPCDAAVLGDEWVAAEKEIAAAVPDLMLMAFRLGITTEEGLTGQADPPWRVVRQRLEAVLEQERQARRAAEARADAANAAADQSAAGKRAMEGVYGREKQRADAERARTERYRAFIADLAVSTHEELCLRQVRGSCRCWCELARQALAEDGS